MQGFVWIVRRIERRVPTDEVQLLKGFKEVQCEALVEMVCVMALGMSSY